MKIEITLMDTLVQAVDAEAERLGCDRSEVVNSAVLRYFSEPRPTFDEEAARIAMKLDDDLRQGLEEVAQRLSLSRDEAIERILAFYLIGDRRHGAAVKIWDSGPDTDQGYG